MNENIKILLAEDDKDDRQFFADAVTELHFKISVEFFKNGSELLKRLYNTDLDSPDIVFLDLNMPVFSGFETLEQIRQDINFKDIPVIAIYSTPANEDGIISTFGPGANAYIVKPLNFNDLKSLLNKAIEMYCREEFKLPVLESFIISV